MRSVSAVALAAGMSLVGASAAEAEAILFSRTATLVVGSGAGPALTFERFDPADGTLTAVAFSLATDKIGTTASISGSFSGGEGGSASAVIRSVFHVFQVGGVSTIFQENGQATSSCSAAPGPSSSCSNSDNDPGSEITPVFPDRVVYTSPSDLENFIDDGAHPTFDVFVSARAIDLGLGVCSDPFGTEVCTVGGGAFWSAELTVAFRFEPTASEVPVPATLGLLGAGLAGLAAARRRRA